MVETIKRIILRFFPELGQRKHLPQLARIENIYDMPANGAQISTAFRAHKAADIQLLNAVTGEPLNVPVFKQVTLATGQGNEHGLFVEPTTGMQCLIQYIDGLDSIPIITSLLPWQTLTPDHKSTDVTLQQSNRSKIAGKNGDWNTETDGKINQNCQTKKTTAQTSDETYHQRKTTIETHDTTKIDGNQINEIMGGLKTLIGEKALIVAIDNLLLGSDKELKLKSKENTTIDSLKNIEAEAKELLSAKGQTVWVGDESVNVLKVLLDVIEVVKNTNNTLATHTHNSTTKLPIQAGVFSGYSTAAGALKSKLSPITA